MTVCSYPMEHKTVEKLFYTTSLNGLGDYSLEIKTFYFDDEQALNNQLLPNSTVFKQTLIFKRDGKIIAQKDFPVKKKIIKKNGTKLIVLDNVIYQIGMVKGKKGGFYKIDGSGGCNGCSEYWGAYSMQGKLLNETYFSPGLFDHKVGNFNEIIKRYALDPAKVKAHDLEVICVFPPKCSGNISKDLIR